ncbi:GNAT family N-acetyltransferase [Streptomyces sp. AK010]|uniref:GNAT family N-acetyltransferase n=1 Tax=Streptomyces sp. AK010 TaxID=2723074 RepID=UPI001621B4C4|nr:GNAT family protein [Streptomyces sp. AK010]MBB6421369.1 RimJ/RimL family protein N-acetyltransferase [Streptomyces sp. AK010]
MTTVLYPHTTTKRIKLRPAGAADAPAAYDILFRNGHGPLPLLDRYAADFCNGLSACFMIHDAETDELLGFSTLSDLKPAGHLRTEVHLRLGTREDLRSEANALTVNFAFSMWRTRKVYFEVTDPTLARIGFGRHKKAMRPEAVLPDHVFLHGKLQDVHVISYGRDDWDAHGLDFIQQVV